MPVRPHMTYSGARGHAWFRHIRGSLYGFRFPGPSVRDAELQGFCDWFAQWYAHQETQVGMVCDLSLLLLVTPRQRSIWASFEREAESDLERVLLGVAIVANTPVRRGVVTAAYWMNSPVYRWEIVASWDDGVAWLEGLG